MFSRHSNGNAYNDSHSYANGDIHTDAYSNCNTYYHSNASYSDTNTHSKACPKSTSSP